ncbi:MAG TPA: ATP-binding protein, partial [Blastocatellia bacterium]|nr:ATP-binding protein [Blastocatellia bacterium]
MNQQDQEFLDRLRATFRIEAAEHLQTISDGLLALEKEPETAQAAQLIETVYRAAHSLKGAARAVSLGGIEEVCRSLESVLAALKRQTLTFTPELINLLYQTVDLLAEQTEGSGAKHDSGTPPGGAAIIEQLEAAARNERPPAPPETVVSEPELAAPLVGDETGAPPEPASDKPARAETVRISVARLDALLLEAEEMLSVKQATAQLSSELRELRDLTVEWERRWARVQPVARQAEQRSNGKKPASKLDSARLPEFLDWNQSFFRSLQERLTRLSLAAEQERRVTANLVDNLLADVKQAVMMPFAALLEGFPKLARDLARDQGRAVELLIEGGELEIDRRVLDELKDPLIHLVRNSVDHGLEDPPERLRQGKPERGTIVISAAQQGSSRIEITVSDDGAGIDLERVSAAAVRTGLLTPAQAAVLSDEQALSLIFQSGFSTSPVITDISGRGLGLAILRERVERLGGSVTVVSTPHSGTIFRLRLP